MADSVITEDEYATGLFAGIKMQAYGHERVGPIHVNNPNYRAAFESALAKFKEAYREFVSDASEAYIDFPDASMEQIAVRSPKLVHDIGCSVRPDGYIDFSFDQGGADRLLDRRKDERTAFCYAGQEFVRSYFRAA